MQAFHEIRQYDSDFMLWHSSYKNISFLAHWHNEIELIYIRSGKAQMSINNHFFVANEGDLVICDSGDIHCSDSYLMENQLDFIVFDPCIVSTIYQYSYFSHPLITKEFMIETNIYEQCEKVFSLIPKELKNKQSYYQEIVSGLLKDFWFKLKRQLPVSDTQQHSNGRKNYMLNNLQKLLTYVDTHYSENITLSNAADMMNFSLSHFSKFFKKVTGKNFVTYVNMVRIENAINRLHNTTDKVVDIALSCGYNNIRTFNRVFKQFTGYTPSEFCRQKNTDSYTFAFTARKTGNEQFVVNDSITVKENSEKLY